MKNYIIVVVGLLYLTGCSEDASTSASEYISSNYKDTAPSQESNATAKENDVIVMVEPEVGMVQTYESYLMDSKGGAPISVSNTGASSTSAYSLNDEYQHLEDDVFSIYKINDFVLTSEDAKSTFGADVDGASYTLTRSSINYGNKPGASSIRPEEFINYFDYSYKTPENDFSINTIVKPSLFRDSIYNIQVGIQARDQKPEDKKFRNLTFLVDVSGSMMSRMDLVKSSLITLVNNLTNEDFISLTTYAGSVRTLLEATSLEDKEVIIDAINSLESGGGTAMSNGLLNAYAVNEKAFIENGTNRVIVASDGDANIGSTSPTEILKQIEKYVNKGITLTTLGFGRGNFNDELMEQIANKGNGNYYYIDSDVESQRIFSGEKLFSSLDVVAKDLKIQLEFDSESVQSYRLIGYENRDIADSLFAVDTTDAGEIGPNHQVTAFYEVKLNSEGVSSLGKVRIRYQIDGVAEELLEEESILLNKTEEVHQEFVFIQCLVEWAELLRESPFVAEVTLADIEDEFPQINHQDNKAEVLKLIQEMQNF